MHDPRRADIELHTLTVVEVRRVEVDPAALAATIDCLLDAPARLVDLAEHDRTTITIRTGSTSA